MGKIAVTDATERGKPARVEIRQDGVAVFYQDAGRPFEYIPLPRTIKQGMILVDRLQARIDRRLKELRRRNGKV